MRFRKKKIIRHDMSTKAKEKDSFLFFLKRRRKGFIITVLKHFIDVWMKFSVSGIGQK